MKTLYGLLLDIVTFRWKDELKTLFQWTKTSITRKKPPILPYTNHQFCIIVETSLIGKSTVLFQSIRKRKLDNISCVSRVLTTKK